MKLIDRQAECGKLDRLVEAVRAGESRAIVVSGDPGVGKTALLEHLSRQASGCRLARIAGVQSEMELPFAALHQLCAPMLDKLPGLPNPQRDALEIAFGMSSGSAPDRFLVGLAVLGLLSEVAEDQPLVCVWSMTSSGSTAPPRKSWVLWLAVWARSRSGWFSRPVCRAATWRGCRRGDMAADVLRRLAEITTTSGTDWALGIEARSRALLNAGDAAERLYRESIERLGRTRIRADLARAHLLYGEWLRRERRRVDARAQLRIAHEMLDATGMDAFAERARRELSATGETARKRTVTSADQELTAQEAQIARMARDGLSNPEIGARLFISARTVSTT